MSKAMMIMSGLCLLLAGCSKPDHSDGSTDRLLQTSQADGDRTPLPPAPDSSVRLSSVELALIHKGRKVQPNQLLSVVGITKGSGKFPVCTGTVIAQDIVLTAAHCICAGATGHIYIGDSPLKKGVKGHGYYPVRSWKSAMTCGKGNTKDGLDLAVLRTTRNIIETPPMSLSDESAIDRTVFARVVGFGAVDENGKVFRQEKREADVRVESKNCQGEDEATYYKCLPGSEIVAGRPEGPDSCSGDSGGPLLTSLGETTRGTHYSDLRLAGVTSRGVAGSPKACGGGGIYERLTPFARNWITGAVNDLHAANR